MKVKIGKGDALIVVDVQRDFCPGGALPVPRGDEVIPVLNEYLERFRRAGAAIYATRDWHPPNHKSFREYGGEWPPHCIQGTEGAEFHPNLKLPSDTLIISKATEPDKEAYSGFEGTNLKESLESRGVKRVFVGGLATDYCVKSTVLDALKYGFEVFLLVDAVRGVDLQPGDSERAIEEMVRRGAKKITLSDLE
ncbi:bifunctional nicotinamidase/pyrazinamidase [Candidatus Bathyarchaeota archaeon]|nr:MAG: nicotinamidase [Candidatus Bathyarchaeota archaeon ex4484_40]RJS67774.1 MAG: bifunctional nicotinamidase/pyrazinamidase [Candidatus Bathyarchaeota archaeon]RJS77908.1 MAG: bifunctional nicotinamidase/pyrazinamidase [Candidatus Bathyarchaeota archaeon]